MTIRRAIPVFIGLALLSIVAVAYAVAHLTMLRAFSIVEKREAEHAWAAASSVLDAELAALRSAVHLGALHWAPAPAEDAVMHELVNILGADCAVLIRTDGTIAAGGWFADRHAPPSPLQDELIPFLVREVAPAPQGAATATCGLAMTPNGPMLFAASAVRQGPAEELGGTLIVGRLAEGVAARIAASIRGRVTIIPPASAAAPVIRPIEVGLRAYPLTPHVMAAEARVPVLGETRGPVLRVEVPRVARQLADYASWQTMLGLASAGFVLVVVTLVLSERLILRRLARLADAVRCVSGEGGSTARVPADGTDELATLGAAINTMLDATANAQAVLRASEDRFRRMADNIPDGLAIIEGGTTVYVNDRLCEITGYSKEELMRLSGFDLAVPEEKDRLRDMVRGLKQGAYPQEAEFWIERKDGARRCIRNRYSLSRVSGAVTGRFVVTTDITEHTVAARELGRLRDFNELLVQTVAEGIVVEDAQGLYRYVNPAAATMLGYGPDELVGRHWTSIVPPDQRPRVEAANARRRQGVSDRYELLVVRKDGQRLQVSVSGAPLTEGGVFAGTIAVYTDISQRKREEQEREDLLAHTRRQAEQIRRIIDTVPEGVVVTDGAFRVSLANHAAEAYLRALGQGSPDSAAELGGVRLAELFGSTAPDAWHELKAPSSDRVFDIAARPLDPQGWVMIIREVTEERAAQVRARAAERMEGIGQVAAGIAHDFNNILASIVGHAQLLLRNRSLPQDTAERVRSIAEQGHRAATLVGQLLDYARQSLLDRTPVDLCAVARDVGGVIRQAFPDSVRLSIECSPSPCWVHGSATQLHRVVMNLARNAVDAMPSGGELRIEVAPHRLTRDELPSPEMDPGDWVLLSVADTGRGIPPEHMSRLFQPFFTTKAVGEGTGLGLAQAYGLVRQHDGFIHVATALNRGTTFTVYLPLHATDESVPRAPRTVPHAQPGGTILLVEDEQPVREVIDAMLCDLGFSVVQASSATEALEIYRRRSTDIDVVLTDLMMPGMNGLALAEHLARLNPQVRVVVVSGYPLDASSRGRLSAIAGGWVQKPVIMEQLQVAVMAAMTRPATPHGIGSGASATSSMRA